MKTAKTIAMFVVVGIILALGGAAQAELVGNGGFESNSGNNSTPAGWTKDFNSYGAFDGAANAGSYGLYPGAGAGTGGEYQDITTVARQTYDVSLAVQNFNSNTGSSHVKVLIGSAGTDTYPVDDFGQNTTKFSTTGLLDQTFATAGDGSWTNPTFQFTAGGTATRLGVYNSDLAGDTQHSVNVDDVSVALDAPELIANGGFETNSGNNSTPAGWTKDFNSYGAYDGAINHGSYGLHPGFRNGTGGEYQDMTTVAGQTYDVSLWVQNFDSNTGSSHLKVLVGSAGTDTYAVDDFGQNTTMFSTSGLLDQTFATAGDGSWTNATFQFTAGGTATRFGVYNSWLTGDSVHSINVDDVSLTIPEPCTMLALLAGVAGLGGYIRNRKRF